MGKEVASGTPTDDPCVPGSAELRECFPSWLAGPERDHTIGTQANKPHVIDLPRTIKNRLRLGNSSPRPNLGLSWSAELYDDTADDNRVPRPHSQRGDRAVLRGVSLVACTYGSES